MTAVHLPLNFEQLMTIQLALSREIQLIDVDSWEALNDDEEAQFDRRLAALYSTLDIVRTTIESMSTATTN